MATDTAPASSSAEGSRAAGAADLLPATTKDYDGKVVGFPPDGPAEQRRAWFQHELKQHRNPATGRGWTQADVAREAECVEAHVSLVLSGTRKSGDVTKSIQRVVAKALRRKQSELFGVICTSCPNCGASHAPRRMKEPDE